MTPEPFWRPLALTLELALATTTLLLAGGVPLAYWLASTRSRLGPLARALVSLPLVLPPTVLGFYLLLLWSPAGPFGRALEEALGARLVFSFSGIVLASAVSSLPFMVHPVLGGFEGLPPSLAEASYTLGKSRWETLRRVLLPNMRPALVAGAALSFAHSVGEFGAILMVGGSIPGETRVASVAIYNEVEALNYGAAHLYSLCLLGVTLPALWLMHLWQGPRRGAPARRP